MAEDKTPTEKSPKIVGFPVRYTVPVAWDTGDPATVKCGKCNAEERVIPLKMERESFLSPLYVSEYLLPEKWTRISIYEAVPDEEEEVLRATVFVCPDCTVRVE
jgi:hypothetical protein